MQEEYLQKWIVSEKLQPQIQLFVDIAVAGQYRSLLPNAILLTKFKMTIAKMQQQLQGTREYP